VAVLWVLGTKQAAVTAAAGVTLTDPGLPGAMAAAVAVEVRDVALAAVAPTAATAVMA